MQNTLKDGPRNVAESAPASGEKRPCEWPSFRVLSMQSGSKTHRALHAEHPKGWPAKGGKRRPCEWPSFRVLSIHSLGPRFCRTQRPMLGQSGGPSGRLKAHVGAILGASGAVCRPMLGPSWGPSASLRTPPTPQAQAPCAQRPPLFTCPRSAGRGLREAIAIGPSENPSWGHLGVHRAV